MVQKLFRQNKNFLWIIQFEKYDIGSIRASFLKKREYEIDIFVEKKYRGYELAAKALAKAEENFDIGTSLYSYIKKSNVRSFNFFKKNKYLISQSSKKYGSCKKKYSFNYSINVSLIK